jgi:ABC-type branched-subunit amino acid transport system substrate-binding protein
MINDNGECVGTTDGSFIFDPGSPGIAQAERDIAAENARVQHEAYVTVALLAPLTWSPQSAVSLERIRNELEGAYVAQHAANFIQDISPKIRLVLANEGSLEQAAPQITGQLKALTAAPDRLVAVIGMGISVNATLTAAGAFSAANIPMVGSVDTGDTLDWTHVTGLARVAVTSNEEAVRTAAYLKAHGGLGTDFMVTDTDKNDLYTSGIRTDFQTAFGTHISAQEPYGPGPDIGNEFALIADDVCGIPGPPPTVIYAGREVVLPTFIQQLEGAPTCNGRHLTVVTGSDAEGLDPRSTIAQPGKSQQPNPAQVSVVYPGLANPGDITQQFRTLFTASFGTTGIDDPWMIETNNAMAAAARAIALATGDSSTSPLPKAVLDAIPLLNRQHMVQGATGPFAIGSDGNLMNPDIPIFEIAAGNRQLLSP